MVKRPPSLSPLADFGPGARDQRSTVQQVQEEIQNLIEREGLRVGQQLPSEWQLADRFSVARGTVREAFKALEQSGLVSVQHGRGRFVSALAGLGISRPITRFESVTDMLLSRGHRSVTRVLSLERVHPDDTVRTALDIPHGVEIIRLLRVRQHAGEALILSWDAFSAELLMGDEPHESDFTGSLCDWLEARGRRPVSSAAQIQACRVPQDLADISGVDSSQPWLLITERCVDDKGAPVLFSRDYHCANVFSFHFLRRSGA
jgi:GntR family transcriptional regulator